MGTTHKDPTAVLAERNARVVKAVALADVLQAAGADGSLPVDAETTWRLAEAAAGVRPSSRVTRRLTVGMLADRARYAAGDPFEGLV